MNREYTYKQVSIFHNYSYAVPLRIRINFPQLVPSSICSSVLTDLLGSSISLVRSVGHHTRGHRDARLLQQPDAHVLMQGEVSLLLHRQHWGRLVPMVTK